MPTKIKKDAVTPSFSQQEAKDLAAMLEVHTITLSSIGDNERAERCKYLRGLIVQASGKVPGE